jgi:hypothetical protein
MARLSSGIPVCIDVNDCKGPVLLFTDGSYEPVANEAFRGRSRSDGQVADSPAKVGAVLVDPAGGKRFYFGGPVPGQVLARWLSGGKRQPIGQVELYPVLLAFKAFQEELRGRLVLIFIDNEAARAGLVAGSSSVAASGEIIGHVLRLEQDLAIRAWYTRVPSASNCADPPSRDQFAETERRFQVSRVAMPAPDESWFAESGVLG